MTIQDLLDQIESFNLVPLLVFFLIPPLAAWLLGFRQTESREKPRVRYLYTVLVYWACLPGMLACVLTGYALFFLGRNLLTLDIFVFYLPIAAMIATLVLIGRSVAWKRLPGVDRLYALMTLLGVGFVIALFLVKTRIWILFGGSILMLFVLGFFCFLVLKWAGYMLFRKKDEPPRRFPSIEESKKAKKWF